MKELKTYITEAFKINKNLKLQKYNYFPKTKDGLKNIIKWKIANEGNECDLNDIDTSKIKDMSNLFFQSDFNGDISRWDVSNVKSMCEMFEGSIFNQDISKWDVSNVKLMRGMFDGSKFNQDISNWDVSNVTVYNEIFYDCPIEEKYKPKFK